MEKTTRETSTKEIETNYGSWFAIVIILSIVFFFAYKGTHSLLSPPPTPAPAKGIESFIITNPLSDDASVTVETVEKVLYEGNDLSDEELDALIKQFLEETKT